MVIDIYDLRTRAWIADDVTINPTGLGLGSSSALISATDVSKIVNIAGAVAATTGSAGVGIGIDVEIIDKDTRAYIGKGVTLKVAGNVDVTTAAGLTYFGVAATLGASTSAGIGGSFIVVLLGQNILSNTHDGTRAYIDGGAAKPTTVSAGGHLNVTASAPNAYTAFSGQIGIGSSAGIGLSVVILINHSVVDAYIAAYDTIGAGAGGVTVSASQSEDMLLLAVGGSVGGTAGVAGSVIVHVFTLTTTAHIDSDATVTSGGKIAVAASDSDEDQGRRRTDRDRRHRRRRHRRRRRSADEGHRGMDRPARRGDRGRRRHGRRHLERAAPLDLRRRRRRRHRRGERERGRVRHRRDHARSSTRTRTSTRTAACACRPTRR